MDDESISNLEYIEETQLFSHLISNIYDAALKPALWPEVLERIAHFTGGQAAGLLSKDSVSRAGNAHYHFGVDDRYIQLYREEYWRYDPLSTLIFYDVGHVTSPNDYLTDKEFREGRFYLEWVKPQGWTDSANVVIDKSVTSCAILSVIRDEQQGPVDDAMRLKMRLLVPHIRRAILIGQTIDLKTAKVNAFVETFDGLSAGFFVLDETNRILHANSAGHAMVTDGNAVKTATGRLATDDAEAASILRKIAVSAQNGDAALGDAGVAVPIKGRDGTQYVAHALPLTSGARRQTGVAFAASAALFVRKATLPIPAAPEIIARTFKLTPAELRILLAIVESGGVPDVARTLGVGETTVKFHLRQIFAKTRCSRQADLVKLVDGFFDPFTR